MAISHNLWTEGGREREREGGSGAADSRKNCLGGKFERQRPAKLVSFEEKNEWGRSGRHRGMPREGRGSIRTHCTMVYNGGQRSFDPQTVHGYIVINQLKLPVP